MTRRTIILSVVSIFLLLAGTAVAMSWATRTPTGCGSLATTAAGDTESLNLVVELRANTSSEANAVQSFVQRSLTTLTEDLTKQYSVRLVLLRYGSPVQLTGCLADLRYIVPPKEDLDTYRASSTSEDTKAALKKTMDETRLQKVHWIAAEAQAQVAQVDLAGFDPRKPQLSPLLAWKAGLKFDAPNSRVAILSPLVSTVDDCMARDGAPADLVRDCTKFAQFFPATAAGVSIIVDEAALDPTYARRAEETRTAICEQLTKDNCGVTK